MTTDTRDVLFAATVGADVAANAVIIQTGM